MSGFMRQLKQDNERTFKSRFKQPIKYNQGSAISLQSSLNVVKPQRCHSNNRQVINTPNNPRSINKLSAKSCDRVCDNSLVNYKRTNLSNKNLVGNRINVRSDLCCTKNIIKQYKSNDDVIDQLKSENLKRNTLIRPIFNDDCSINLCNYSNYTKKDVAQQLQRNINNGVNNNCDCRQPRTLDESLRQYKRCNTVKNINTLDSSEYIKLYRSNLVSNNNLPTPRQVDRTQQPIVPVGRCPATNCVNNCN